MIPVNNQPALEIDRTIVVARILNIVGSATDYASDFRQQFTAPIDGQETSTVMVRLAPVVNLEDMPDDHGQLLPFTGFSASKVEIGLEDDKYFKLPVDKQGVKPTQVATELGDAGGVAIVKDGNRNLLAGLVTQGTKVYFGNTFGAGTSSDNVWSALVGLGVRFDTAEFAGERILYIRADVWGKLITDVANLRGSNDPKAAAATLLGVSKVRTVNLPGGALATLSDSGAVAQAKVLSGIEQGDQDFQRVVRGRSKTGTKVLVSEAVLVLTDGAAPAGATG